MAGLGAVRDTLVAPVHSVEQLSELLHLPVEAPLPLLGGRPQRLRHSSGQLQVLLYVFNFLKHLWSVTGFVKRFYLFETALVSYRFCSTFLTF